MEVSNLVQKPNSLSVSLCGTITYVPFDTKTSPEYCIGGVTTFQVKVFYTMHPNDSTNCKNLVCIKFTKLRSDDLLTYIIQLNSKELDVVNQCFNDDIGTWRLVAKYKKQFCTFDIDVQLDFVPGSSPFALLHDDTELTDIELRGEDGSVHVHRAALAACSLVLRRLLTGPWKEKKEATVGVPGTTRLTLEHFKGYLYLRTLPETGLRQLLLLASCYKIEDLEQKCVFKLLGSLSTQNVCDSLEFAVKHKCLTLLYALLDCFNRGVFNVDDIRGRSVRGAEVSAV